LVHDVVQERYPRCRQHVKPDLTGRLRRSSRDV
jgi:hypothetical protein